MENSERTDAELAMAAQTGDDVAFASLVRRHQAAVRAESFSYVGTAQEAEDIAQETFLRAYAKLGTLGPPYNFGGWVRRIARNMARNRRTRGARLVPLEPEHAVHDPWESPADEGLNDRIASAVRALSWLSAPLRETARLSYLSRLSHRQIAERLRIPHGTVKRRLWESRTQMRKEVRVMSRKGRETAPVSLAPVIKIEELPGETMAVEAAGPGVYFGTKLEPGHTEECRFYDYPGGILTSVTRTQVVKIVEMFGRQCYEVLIENTDCEPPEPNVVDYFERISQGYRWVMEVTADEAYPRTRFLKDDEEIFLSRYRSGEHDDYCARVVDLTVGEARYSKCLAVFWGWQGGTPVDGFYTADGREVLHRRYVGPGAPKSRNYEYDTLPQDAVRPFRGVDYRLWYDTVLAES
jgi:RNA polymerase sigma-70 factor (ECF subfamily)